MTNGHPSGACPASVRANNYSPLRRSLPADIRSVRLSGFHALDTQDAIGAGILGENGELRDRCGPPNEREEFRRGVEMKVRGVGLHFRQNGFRGAKRTRHDFHLAEQEGMPLFIAWEFEGYDGEHVVFGYWRIERTNQFDQWFQGRPEAGGMVGLGEEECGKNEKRKNEHGGAGKAA